MNGGVLSSLDQKCDSFNSATFLLVLPVEFLVFCSRVCQ